MTEQTPNRFADAKYEPVNTAARYDINMTGDGQWAVIDGVGVLWCDLKNGAGVGYLPDADLGIASQLRRLLAGYAEAEWTASDAFADVLADNGILEVTAGSLDELREALYSVQEPAGAEDEEFESLTASARVAVLTARIAAAAPKTDDQKAKPLERYWTKGPGLARWAESPTPFRTLVTQLREEIPAGEMTDDQLHGLAATYYRKVKGEWPGKRGKKD